jgi:hypothetical protein
VFPGLQPSDGAEEGFHILVDGEGFTIASAWNLLEVVSILLAVLALALVALAARPITPWLPRLAAGLALALVVFRVVVPPADFLEASTGAFVALGAALVVVVAWLPRPDAAR